MKPSISAAAILLVQNVDSKIYRTSLVQLRDHFLDTDDMYEETVLQDKDENIADLQEEELVAINPVNQGLLYIDSQIMSGSRIMQALAKKDVTEAAAADPAAAPATAPAAVDEGATPSTVNEKTSDKAETTTSASTISDAADSSVSSTPCSQHQTKPGCKTKWSTKEHWDPFPNRIGEYKDKSWVIPEETIHATAPAGITNDTMIQIQDENLSPLDPGFAPFCSSSGWCGHPWGEKKDKEPEPRVGAYSAGEWQIPGSVPDYNKEENPRIAETDSVSESPCTVAGFNGTMRCTA